MHISSVFDSGNIVVVKADEPGDIELEIRPDAGEDHFQWFHYRVSGSRGTALTMKIINARRASYPEGWADYRTVASYDREEWFRVPTRYEGGELIIEHTPDADAVWYAYFAPYSLDRHNDLIAEAQTVEGVTLERLGATVDGRDIDLLQVGEDGDNKRSCWIIARQHPGESMAEWLVEGLLERLFDDEDPVAREVRERACLYVVPNMNPDGSTRGHLRNNAAGKNLNRQWEEPSAEVSPEVFYVRAKMEATGVDFFLDVHGDEALPYNFISGGEGIKSWDDVKAAREKRYSDALLAASPDFQTKFGYPVPEPGEANNTMASNWVGERFGCLAVTLEQPFKDTADTPHPLGWSPARARKFGAAQLDALLVALRAPR
jgi:murein tripeptide amidase MpaA